MGFAQTRLRCEPITDTTLRCVRDVHEKSLPESIGGRSLQRVAWVRDLFAQIDVDSREGKAVAIWKSATDHGASRSDSVSSWLRR